MPASLPDVDPLDVDPLEADDTVEPLPDEPVVLELDALELDALELVALEPVVVFDEPPPPAADVDDVPALSELADEAPVALTGPVDDA
ncbi:MAG: hypothetical protein ABSF69_17150 [Polyangiaceae bacterium]